MKHTYRPDLSPVLVLANPHGSGDGLLRQMAMLRGELGESGLVGVLHGKAIFFSLGELRWNFNEHLPDVDHATRLALEDEIEASPGAG